MFPDIYAQQGLVTGSQWRAGRSHVDYIQAAISLLYQPCPAGTEVADSGRLKRLLELIEAAPFLVDRVGQCAGWSTAAVWFHAVPEEGVVPYLRGVVVNASSRRLFYDGFEFQILVLGALDQVVQIGHISLVMFPMVIFEGFPGHVRLQRVHCKGKCG